MAATSSSVGSTIGRKSVQRLTANSSRRFSALSGGSSRGVVRAGQSVDHFLHDGTAGNLVGALDIGAQLRRRAADDRLRHKSLAQGRNAAQPGRGLGNPREDMGVNRDARHRVLCFQQ